MRVDAIWVASPNALHAEHTIAAARHGKHVICEKPMAVTLEQCASMVEAVERHGIKFVQGHSKVYDTPIRAMGEILATGELGRVVHIDTWNYNDWLLRSLTESEVDTAQGSGVVFRQGPHQADIVRFLGGGLVRDVRATAGRWENGVPEGRGELLGVPGIRGRHRGHHGVRRLRLFRRGGADLGHRRIRQAAAQPEFRRGAAAPERPGLGGGEIRAGARGQLLTATGPAAGGTNPRRGATRSSASPWSRASVACCASSPTASSSTTATDGARFRRRPHRGRAPELLELYDAVTQDRPTLLDARWGMATTEVCLAILQSSRERREIRLVHQVKAPALPKRTPLAPAPAK